MLYVTTRTKHDAYTVRHALCGDTASDGGRFVPRQLPVFTQEELLSMKQQSFGYWVAQILNRFFSCDLTGWDVEFAVGRHPAKLRSMSHRIHIGELWHNDGEEYRWLESVLAKRIGAVGEGVSSWVRIAIRVAVLAGLFGQLLKKEVSDGKQLVDISVPAGDFSVPMAAWYLREMGFPVGSIICCCNENSGVWDLLRLGQLRTGAETAVTVTPLVDTAVPVELERLIFGVLGHQEACRFASACEQGDIYSPKPGMLEPLRKGLYAAVISGQRTVSAIPNVYRTGGYVMGPYTALAYGGLLDHRASRGEGRPCLILADRSPLLDLALVSGAMGMTDTELKAKLS